MNKSSSDIGLHYCDMAVKLRQFVNSTLDRASIANKNGTIINDILYYTFYLQLHVERMKNSNLTIIIFILQ